jgi:hypothetical protein
MIDTEQYQPARQNNKFVTRSLRSLATKLHIQFWLDTLIFSVSINSHPDNIYISTIVSSNVTDAMLIVTLSIKRIVAVLKVFT